MAYVQVPEGLPGIIGPMTAYPETAKPLNLLAEVLLCQETPGFSKAERETVASYVSFLNECQFCSESHAAVADVHWKVEGKAKEIWKSPGQVSERLKSYLQIAAQVQKSGRAVQKAEIEAARKFGATDREIHDCVLIAAAFCLFNRYVDGLATFAPARGDSAYKVMGQMLATNGYVNAIK